MNTYEELLTLAGEAGVDVIDYTFSSTRIKGLYCDGAVALNRKLSTNAERSCVLAEELGHYHTSVGDITNLNDTTNAKQERRARLWGYDNRIGLSGIINSYKAGCRNLYDMADFLEVTETYLLEALECYRQKYGPYRQCDNYVIYFEPNIGVFELI